MLFVHSGQILARELGRRWPPPRSAPKASSRIHSHEQPFVATIHPGLPRCPRKWASPPFSAHSVAMASGGIGTRGTAGRCYSLWIDYSQVRGVLLLWPLHDDAPHSFPLRVLCLVLFSFADHSWSSIGACLAACCDWIETVCGRRDGADCVSSRTR